MKFSINDFFSKCDQIFRKLRIWSHLLKKCLMKSFIFCAVWTLTSVRSFSSFYPIWDFYFSAEVPKQKKNQNLGFSMALFATDKLLVCAPRWKETFPSFPDIIWYRGRCSLLDSQFSVQYSFAPCERGTKPVHMQKTST